MSFTGNKEAIFRATFKEWVKREYTLKQLVDFAKRELPNKAKRIKETLESNIGNASFSTDEVSEVLQQAIREAIRETLDELEE